LIADTQLGRLLDQLEKDKLLDHTLLISSADHGAQTDSFYMGDGKSKPIGIDKSPQMKSADKKTVESIKDSDYAFWILRLYKAGKIKLSSQDTALRLWLEDTSDENKTPILNVLKEISKVTRIFELNNKDNKYFYKEVFSNMNQESKAFQSWAKTHDEEILNASANDEAPHFVALLADNAGFGKLGDHGGNQEKVQRIPLIIVGPNIKKTVDKKWMRLRDIEKIISQQFELPPAPKQSAIQ
jgi:arylsulfatase A-like enzyme